MIYWRYGKIRLSDCLPTIVIILLSLGVGFVAYALRLFAEGSLFFIAAFLTFLSILYPYLERFSIVGNVIISKKLFCSLNIVIPPKSVVVITRADVCPVLSRQSILLKDRFAVSILQDMSLDNALKLIHGKFQSQFMYTNTTIEKTVDEYKFMYSFVLTEGLLKEVLQNTECFLIIPKSVKENIITDNLSIRVYIDSNY